MAPNPGLGSAPFPRSAAGLSSERGQGLVSGKCSRLRTVLGSGAPRYLTSYCILSLLSLSAFWPSPCWPEDSAKSRASTPQHPAQCLDQRRRRFTKVHETSTSLIRLPPSFPQARNSHISVAQVLQGPLTQTPCQPLSSSLPPGSASPLKALDTRRCPGKHLPNASATLFLLFSCGLPSASLPLFPRPD